MSGPYPFCAWVWLHCPMFAGLPQLAKKGQALRRRRLREMLRALGVEFIPGSRPCTSSFGFDEESDQLLVLSEDNHIAISPKKCASKGPWAMCPQGKDWEPLFWLAPV